MKRLSRHGPAARACSTALSKLTWRPPPSQVRAGVPLSPPFVENGRLVGIVAQADIALRDNKKKTGELVEAISEPSEGERR